jgi:uracil-DNA glycosylase family 4
MNTSLELTKIYYHWKACEQCYLGRYKYQRPQWRWSIMRDGDIYNGFSTTYPESDVPMVMFVGEAPGDAEIEVGEPFVGRSGRLLNNMIDRVRERYAFSLFILNAVLCAPVVDINQEDKLPIIGTPDDESITACSDRVIDVFKVVKPDLVVALGSVAHKSLGKLKIDHVHLKHPAYLLRQGGVKGVSFKREILTLDEAIRNICQNQNA